MIGVCESKDLFISVFNKGQRAGSGGQGGVSRGGCSANLENLLAIFALRIVHADVVLLGRAEPFHEI
jgi:hypothetical protein